MVINNIRTQKQSNEIHPSKQTAFVVLFALCLLTNWELGLEANRRFVGKANKKTNPWQMQVHGVYIYIYILD